MRTSGLPVQARRAGYILIEAVMAMALLSIGLIAIQGAIRQTILVRGQARDYTTARFLLEETLAKVELQPLLIEGADSGAFRGDFERFSWSWRVYRVEVPPPPFPADLPPEEIANFKLSASYVAKVEASVSWTRSGQQYREKFETLWGPDKLFVPKPEQGM